MYKIEINFIQWNSTKYEGRKLLSSLFNCEHSAMKTRVVALTASTFARPRNEFRIKEANDCTFCDQFILFITRSYCVHLLKMKYLLILSFLGIATLAIASPIGGHQGDPVPSELRQRISDKVQCFKSTQTLFIILEKLWGKFFSYC